MYNLQTRSFVLLNACGYTFFTSKFYFLSVNDFFFNKLHFVKCKSQAIEYKFCVTEY